MMVSFKTDNLLIASEEWESVSNELKVDPINVSTSKNGIIKENIRMHWGVQTILEVPWANLLQANKSGKDRSEEGRNQDIYRN
jgi:hypothetical protein